MNDFMLKSLGRSSELLDAIVRGASRSETTGAGARFDRTGILVDGDPKLDVLYRSDDLLFAAYDRPSHSFWRAQELSLFWRHRNLFQAPIADFGCGDGSFASALFDSVDIGIDQDPDALCVADRFHVYRRLVESDERRIPIENQVVQTIMSNSVLEHVSDLNAILGELRRITAPGGRLLFTVPVVRYREHLTKYFGGRVSERINRDSFHRNLLSETEWRKILSEGGFAVDMVVHYQPDWYTFWYRFHRLTGPRSLGRLIPDLDRKLWRRFRAKYLDAVRESIGSTSDGANIFVVAHRRP